MDANFTALRCRSVSAVCSRFARTAVLSGAGALPQPPHVKPKPSQVRLGIYTNCPCPSCSCMQAQQESQRSLIQLLLCNTTGQTAAAVLPEVLAA